MSIEKQDDGTMRGPGEALMTEAMIQRYAIKPVLKSGDNGTQYAAFEYVENDSGMCVFFGDHRSTLQASAEKIFEILGAVTDEPVTIELALACLRQQWAARDKWETQATERVKTLQHEVEWLNAWKTEQLAVESTWDPQEVAHELGLKFGVPIRAEILPRIKDLKDALKVQEQRVERLRGNLLKTTNNLASELQAAIHLKAALEHQQRATKEMDLQLIEWFAQQFCPMCRDGFPVTMFPGGWFHDTISEPSQYGSWPFMCGVSSMRVKFTEQIARRVGDQEAGEIKCDEVGWLIEKSIDGAPQWLTAAWEFGWTPDADKAIRFSRRQDAEQIASMMENEPISITEHTWVSGDRPEAK